MDIVTLMSILRPLFELSTEVMGTNFQLQARLARSIQQSGKTVDQMTVAQIRQLVDAARAEHHANQ